MARRVEELYEKAKERAEEGVEQAWAAEIERRMDDFEAGRAETISWSELRAHLHRFRNDSE